MFDIYLSIGCRALPDMEDLAQDVPILRDTAFQQKLLTPSPKRPGFLGLDVSELLAKTLLRRLQSVRAVGFWLSSAYRQPRISREQAEVFAAQVLPEISARHFQHYPGDTLSPLFFAGEKPEYWVFKAELEQFRTREGGGMWISIDKLDGHIWTRKDFDKRETRLEDVEWNNSNPRERPLL